MSSVRSAAPVVALVLALVLALGGQAMTDRLAPGAGSAATGRAVGQATLSYVSGLRTFVAAVLWMRLEPTLHGFYNGVPLEQQRYMLSTTAAVQALDPNLQQPFYIGAWILARNDRADEALAMAERGVRENPDAGLLLTNLAEIQMLYADDLPGAVETAQTALGPEVVWLDFFEQHNAYPVLGAIFRAAGRDDLDAIVQAELERMDAELGDQLPADAHDHDGDGTPDH